MIKDPNEDLNSYYRCTRCPNVVLLPEDRIAHREMHRRERLVRETRAAERRRVKQEIAYAQAQAAKRPGPASRTLPRKAKQPRLIPTTPSVISSDSLFERLDQIDVARNAGFQVLYNQDQLSQMRGDLVDEPVDDDTDPDSAANRRHRAVRRHIRNTPIYRSKFPGA